MRQRERTRVDVWLRCLTLGEGDTLPDPYGEPLITVHAMLLELGSHWGRMVIIWQEMGTFRVQVLPTRDMAGVLSAPLGASYRGNRLGQVLERAILDAALLATGATTWEGSAREVIQWVA
jgi:hypothetical protein